MPESKVDPRLALIVGTPLVALVALAVFAISAQSTSADPGLSLWIVGIGAALSAAAGAVGLLVLGKGLAKGSTADPGVSDEDHTPTTDTGSADALTHENASDDTRFDAVVAVAEELATERLPELRSSVVQSLDAPPAEDFPVPEGQGVAVRLGHLLNEIQTVAFDTVEAQRETVRAGLSDLVVNLVRRNQSLLDRQLESIDHLETSEEDPERLDQLYGLDLLATRMRRNAESLLVLAGTEPPRRRNGPVSVSDIGRVAVSEIEHYRRIEFGSIEASTVAPAAVVDIAHMLSELLDNATSFSPPDSTVTLGGSTTDDGGYEITIVDGGVGMSEEQLQESNRTLADPPNLSLGLSRMLGFVVVGRLAKRHELRVELTQVDGGGIKAALTVPASLLLKSHDGSDGEEADGDVEAEDDDAAIPLAVRGQETGWSPAPIADTEASTPESPPREASDAESEQSEPAMSDALARLLGTGATSAASNPSSPADASAEAENASADEADESGAIEESSKDTGRPESLDDAVPTGEKLEHGIESLLSPGSIVVPPRRGTAPAGLTKRDRSQSHAPAREGRQIPADQISGNAVAASSRKPEEIKNMLASYREARHRPVEASSEAEKSEVEHTEADQLQANEPGDES